MLLRSLANMGRRPVTAGFVRTAVASPIYCPQAWMVRPTISVGAINMFQRIMVAQTSFGFSALTRKLALARLPKKKYKLKTRKSAYRRFKVVSTARLTISDWRPAQQAF